MSSYLDIKFRADNKLSQMLGFRRQLFVLLFPLALAQTELHCDTSDQARCFFVTDDRLSFAEATAACAETSNAVLAEPRSAADTAAIAALFPSLAPVDFVWVGLTDEEEEGVYRWASDDSVQEDYFNWYQGELEFRQEPDGGTSENCVIAQVSKGWAWNDYDCNRRNNALCQINF